MRIAFGPALPVGAAGDAELFDVWLTDFVWPDEVARPAPGVHARGPCAAARPVRGRVRAPRSRRLVTAARYEVRLPGRGSEAARIAEALAATASRGRGGRGAQGQDTHVRPSARSAREPPAVEASEDGDAVAALLLRLGQEGSLRPDALVAAVAGV